MKKETEKTILDKLDEIGAPVRNILEGTEDQYEGFKPLAIERKVIPLPTNPNRKSTNSNKKRKKKKKSKKKRRR